MTRATESGIAGRRRRWFAITSVGVGAAAVVCGLAFAVFVLPGPLRGRTRRAPAIVVLPPVVSLQRLADEAAQEELHPKRPSPEPEDIPPEGVIPNEWQPVYITSGKRFHCICTGGRPTRVWLYDAQWHVLGEVKPPRDFDREGDGNAFARWDAQGQWLAICFRAPSSGHGLAVSVLAPPDPEPRVRFRTNGTDWAWMFWAGDRLLVGYCDVPGQKNVVEELIPASGQVRRAYSEPAQEWNRIMSPVISPDARYLAFTRARDSITEHRDDYTVWLLDLHAFVAMPLTGESKGGAQHWAIRWDGPSTLLFLRAAEVYRATLDLPVSAPSEAGPPSAGPRASPMRLGDGRAR